MKTRWYQQLLSIVVALALLVQLLPLQALASKNTMDEEITSLTNSLIESEAPLVTVVCEEETLRTETEKHFRMSDGSFMAVSYGTPVHYMDDDGILRLHKTSAVLRQRLSAVLPTVVQWLRRMFLSTFLVPRPMSSPVGRREIPSPIM